MSNIIEFPGKKKGTKTTKDYVEDQIKNGRNVYINIYDDTLNKVYVLKDLEELKRVVDEYSKIMTNNPLTEDKMLFIDMKVSIAKTSNISYSDPKDKD